jgi:hypothetical protein
VAIAGLEQAASDKHRKARIAPSTKNYPNVARRTTMLHPVVVFWEKNEKSHPRPEKAPNGINAAAIN